MRWPWRKEHLSEGGRQEIDAARERAIRDDQKVQDMSERVCEAREEAQEIREEIQTEQFKNNFSLMMERAFRGHRRKA